QRTPPLERQDAHRRRLVMRRQAEWGRAFWPLARAVPNGYLTAASGRQEAAGEIPGQLSHLDRIAPHLEILAGGVGPEMDCGVLISRGEILAVRRPGQLQHRAFPLVVSHQGCHGRTPE